ncbi:MAG: PepSY domain-containing protein [Bacilli bacterium]|nr:PepSY domain-containing protein [Bacilli bacterium]
MNNLVKLIIAGMVSLTTIGVGQNMTTTQNEVKKSAETSVQVDATVKEEVTLEEAKKVALNKENGTVTKTTEDKDDYTIFVKRDNYIYEIEVDKNTGNIDDLDKEVVKTTNQVTLAEAKKVALNKVNGTVTKTTEDKDDYTIFVKKDNYIYEIEVDKNTGNIDDMDKEKVKTNSSASISLNKAKELALKEVNGTIISTKRDDDDYEITIQKDNYTYEIEVSKKTGKITDIDKEKVATTVNIISKSKAKEIALAQVAGTVTSVDYEDDDYKYEIEIVKDNLKYDIEIDGRNGQVIKVEKDD